MKKIFFLSALLFTLCSFQSSAQTPSGAKYRFAGSWFSSRDTSATTSADSNSIVFRKQDSTFYVKALGYWSPLAKGAQYWTRSAGILSPLTSTDTVSAKKFNVGSLGFTDVNVLGSFQSSVNAYNQIVLQNSNSGSSASSGYVVTNNNGTASTYYGEFGMNSSGFSGSGSFNAPNYVYLTATSGDLAIGTTTNNNIHFVLNNGSTDAALINSTGLTVTGAVAATSFSGPGTGLTGLTKYSDTATMLSPYLHFQAGVKYYDTATMLSNRLKISDTANAFSNYLRKTTLILPAEGGTGYTSLASLAGDAAFTGAFQAKATNLTSLAGLSYASTSFVKMTAAGTFALDVNTYLTTSASANLVPYTGATGAVTLGSNSFTAGAISSSVSSGNNINLDKSGGAAINFTRSAVQHFLMEDDANGLGFYYGSSPTLGTTVGQYVTTGSLISTNDVTSSGGVGRFGGTYTGTGYTGPAVEIAYNGGNAQVFGYDRGGSVYKPLVLAGGTAGGNTSLTLTNTGATFSAGVITPSYFKSTTGASGTLGSGAAFIFDNGLTSTSQREITLQLNASFGLSLWYYNGTSGVNTGLSLNNDGSVTTGGNVTIPTNSYFNNATNSVQITGNFFTINGGAESTIYFDANGSGSRNKYIHAVGNYDDYFAIGVSAHSTNIGFEIYRDETSGSYNTTWDMRMTGSSTDLQFANGGTSVLSVATTGKLTATNLIVSKGYTVATLPTGVTGAWAYVTDASGPTYGATVVGGGSVVTPVFYNGSNWTCR